MMYDLIIRPPFAHWGPASFTCFIGHGGIELQKREGDGATPVGIFPFREVFYRADRIGQPFTALPVTAMTPEMGWCDAPQHLQYNRLIAKPFDASHECLYRQDGVYDLVLVVGHNDAPPLPEQGSAIFVHLKGDKTYTEGCVALDLDDLLHILSTATAKTTLRVPRA